MKKLVLTIIFLFSFLITPSAQTVYLAKTGPKYHISECRSLKSSIPIELKDALDRGYTARTGAVCNDRTRTTAGSGACSYHVE